MIGAFAYLVDQRRCVPEVADICNESCNRQPWAHAWWKPESDTTITSNTGPICFSISRLYLLSCLNFYRFRQVLSMELRSSRRLTRSSGHTAQKRAFITRTVAPRVPSRLSSSGNKWLYRLRSGRFSVESERHAGTSRLGLSRSAYSRLGPASRGLLSGTRDDFSYRGRSGTVAIESRILRECSICVDKKGMYVLSIGHIFCKLRIGSRRQFPSIECLPKCGHITSVCRSCIVRHIMGALERHEQWHQIPCLECREPLGEVFVESSVTRRDFQKYSNLQFLCNAVDPGLRKDIMLTNFNPLDLKLSLQRKRWKPTLVSAPASLLAVPLAKSTRIFTLTSWSANLVALNRVSTMVSPGMKATLAIVMMIVIQMRLI